MGSACLRESQCNPKDWRKKTTKHMFTLIFRKGKRNLTFLIFRMTLKPSPWVCRSNTPGKGTCHVHLWYTVHEDSWGQEGYCLTVYYALLNFVVLGHTAHYISSVRWIYCLHYLIVTNLALTRGRWLQRVPTINIHRLKVLQVQISHKSDKMALLFLLSESLSQIHSKAETMTV